MLWVGDRRWPLSHWMSSDFTHDWAEPPWTQHVRGCHVSFENGWTASLLWGDGTYSDNKLWPFEGHEFVEEPHGVEVLIFSTIADMSDTPFHEPFSASPALVNCVLDVLAEAPSQNAVTTAERIAEAVVKLLAGLPET